MTPRQTSEAAKALRIDIGSLRRGEVILKWLPRKRPRIRSAKAHSSGDAPNGNAGPPFLRGTFEAVRSRRRPLECAHDRPYRHPREGLREES